MMNRPHYIPILILLLLSYYHGGFCLESDALPATSQFDERTKEPKAPLNEMNSISNEHSKNAIKKEQSTSEETKPVPENAQDNRQTVNDKPAEDMQVKLDVKQPEKPAAKLASASQSPQPADPVKHVQDTMTEHAKEKATVDDEAETQKVAAPSNTCNGKQVDGVLCDDVQKVISPELPKLSQEFDKVPPEVVKVQEEGIRAPPEVKDKQEKADSITEPEPVKQNAVAQEETKQEKEVPKPDEIDAAETPKGVEKKTPVVENSTEAVGEKKVPEVVDEKKEGTTADTETVTPPIEDDMPSFNEWKKKQHDAEKEEEKEKSKQNGHTTQPGSTGSQLTRPSTMRTNYASLSCGAKVLSHNSEVQHAAYTLNDNKDEYMINPCSANKWFIVELCEPVQVKYVEVANYELFSSLPKDVRLHTSDKYPSKDWKLLDTYTASEERKIHIFPVIGQQLYSKYLKVEVLTHFGTEHFCPLTLLRVFGTSYAEIDDDDDHDDAVHTDEQVQADGATNIFTSATDIVMNVVKKVLKGSDDTQKPLDGQFLPNAKDDANNTDGYILPCLQDQIDQQAFEAKIKPDVPRPTSGSGTTGSNVILDSIIRPSVPYPTIPQPVADEIRRSVSVVSVINYYGATVLGAMCNLFQNCHACETPQSKYRSFAPLIGQGPCIYMCILTKCWQRIRCCCKNCHKKSDLKRNPVPAQEQMHPYSTAVIDSITPTIQPTVTSQSSFESAADYEKPTVQMPVGDVSTSVHIPLTTPDGNIEGTLIQPTKTLKSEDAVVGSVQSSLTKSEFSHRNIKTLTASDTKHESVTHVVSEPTEILSSSLSVSTMGPDVVQGSASKERISTQTVISPSSVVVEAVPPQEEEKAPPVEDAKKVTPPAEVPVQQNGNGNGNGNSHREEIADAAQNGGKDYKEANGNGDQIVQDLPVTGAASAGKRESAIMRLNNRVKALELNMSLSSRYLEELSQRYKKQMEAMYRSFNITIGRLMNTSKWAEQSDQRQKEKMSKLHARIEEFTQIVEGLNKDLDKMNVKHLENHLVFLVLETMVMFILFLMCSRRNKQRTTPAELQELLANMPDHPNIKQRHNSDPAINKSLKPVVSKSRSLSDVDTKHAASDGNLFIVEPANFPFLNEKKDLSEGKKKKRKKPKKLPRAASTGQFVPSLQNSTLNSSTTIASAGLLFSGPQGKNMKCESVNGVRMRTLSRSSSMNHIDVIFENSSSSCTLSSQSNEGFKFENMTSNEAANKRSRRHTPKSSPDYGAVAKTKSLERQDWPLQEIPVRSSPPFHRKYGRKYAEDVGARFNGYGPRRVENGFNVDTLSPNSDSTQHFRRRQQFADNIESYSDTGGNKRKPGKHDFDTHSDNGKFQRVDYVDVLTDFPVKSKKSFHSGGKKKPFERQGFDGMQSQGPGPGRGRGRGGYRGRPRDMDGLGGFKTWVSYRH